MSGTQNDQRKTDSVGSYTDPQMNEWPIEEKSDN